MTPEKPKQEKPHENPLGESRPWIKLWVAPWLDGTTRYEMSGSQRAFWIDLPAQAARKGACMMDSVVRKHLDRLTDPDVERAVLAAIMFDQDKLQCTAEKLTIGDFAINANRKIFGAMLRMSRMNREISMCEVLVEMEMRGEVEAIGGPDYICSLENSKGYRADFDLGRCVGVIRRLAARRLFVQGCWELMRFAGEADDTLDFDENIWIRIKKLNDAIERLDKTYIPLNN